MSGEGGADRPGSTSLGVGGTLVALGLGITGWMALAGGYPSFGPILLAAVGAPPLLLGILARRSRSPGPVLRREGVISMAFVGLVFVACGLSLGVEREERFEMSWSHDVDERGNPDPARILLEFVDHPGWVSKVTSRDLALHLESLGTDRVPVVFLVTRDFGSVRSFIEVQVGERREWKDGGFGGFSRRTTDRSRSAGGIGPSPFR